MTDRRTLVRYLRLASALLVLQLAVGIWVYLYGSFPRTSDLGTALMYSGDPVLSVHYVLAAVLVILGLVLVVLAFRAETPPRLRVYVVGAFLAVLWACASGVAFILSGFSNNGASISMLLAFLVTMAFYGLAQASARSVPPTPTRTDPDARTA